MTKHVYSLLTVGGMLFGGYLFSACGDKKDPKMEEAGKVHLEAMEIEESIHQQIEGIDSLKIVLSEKKKTLTDAAAIASLDSTVAALDAVAGSLPLGKKAW